MRCEQSRASNSIPPATAFSGPSSDPKIFTSNACVAWGQSATIGLCGLCHKIYKFSCITVLAAEIYDFFAPLIPLPGFARVFSCIFHQPRAESTQTCSPSAWMSSVCVLRTPPMHCLVPHHIVVVGGSQSIENHFQFRIGPISITSRNLP